MPTFRYIAVDAAGHRYTGEMTDVDQKSVTERLREMNRFPAEIVALSSDHVCAEFGSGATRRKPVARSISSRDPTVFSRQLSNLAKRGLPLLRSLNALIEHTESPRLRLVITEVRDAVESGSSLWEALGQHPGIFPAFYVNMVKAGEASGQLQSILQWLADLMEAEQQKRTQVRSAFAYTALLLSVGAAAVFLLTTFLIPRFVSLFRELHQALPLATVVLLTVASFLARWWWALLAGIGLSVSLVKLYVTTPTGRYLWDTLRLRMPLFGKLSLKIAVARLARTLSTLVRGGVPILTALEVVRDVVGNERLARGIDYVRTQVREGSSIADPLRETGLFPALLSHMVAVGEETAELEGVLMTVAATYDVEVENSVKALLSLLEPAIIIVMAGIIGSIIAAMLLPIFQMNLFPAR